MQPNIQRESDSPMWNGKNTLYYGDNLPILREYIPSESVDLIYLDPPFNSNRSYNVLFKNESGQSSEAQIEAFEDTWHWNDETEALYTELVTHTGGQVGHMVGALREVISTKSQMMAYIVMMAARLVELHRVLRHGGSIYLHCDPTASHYLRILMDTVFGPQNFMSEIVWKRYGAHNDSKSYGAVHDVILFYGKGHPTTFNKQHQQYDEAYIAERFRFQDPDGRRWSEQNLSSPNPRPNLTYSFTAKNGVTYLPPANGWKYTRENMAQLDKENRLHYPKRTDGRLRLKNYLDELPGVAVQDVWTDISLIGGTSPERLGYPTQKPLALLERIISASSNPGDVVLDPFAGCGTAVIASQKLGRRWIGIDITHLAIGLLKYRLQNSFPDLSPKTGYKVVGEPTDFAGAWQLSQDDRYQFQWWAISLVGAKPVGGTGKKEGKKGADQGIDGEIVFIDDGTGKPKRVIVQVKSGHVNRANIGELVGTVQRENAAIGVFVTLEPPTQPMKVEAASAGMYESKLYGQRFPKIQILTIEELMNGARVQMPPTSVTFQVAPKVQVEDPNKPRQGNLLQP